METLKEVLARYGFNFKKSFGQNFLTDAGLLASIVKGADCAGKRCWRSARAQAR